MTRGRRAAIPQRRRIFLGCEGQSERGYGKRLFDLVEARHHRVHLDTVLLGQGGGDPITLLRRAVAHILRQKQTRSGYAFHAILLDTDRRGLRTDRDQEAYHLAARHKITLIWQEPCHEAFLLRHLVGCQALRPTASLTAEAELKKRWPAYRKASTAAELAEVIDAAAVHRAADVEPNLKVLLAEIDFPPG